MVNDWISSNDEICADNFNNFQFKYKGCSEMWEVHLYGDKTIKIDRDSVEVLPRGVPPLGIGGVGFGSPPNLAMDHAIYELCPPTESEQWSGIHLLSAVEERSLFQIAE